MRKWQCRSKLCWIQLYTGNKNYHIICILRILTMFLWTPGQTENLWLPPPLIRRSHCSSSLSIPNESDSSTFYRARIAISVGFFTPLRTTTLSFSFPFTRPSPLGVWQIKPFILEHVHYARKWVEWMGPNLGIRVWEPRKKRDERERFINLSPHLIRNSEDCFYPGIFLLFQWLLLLRILHFTDFSSHSSRFIKASRT